MAVSSFVSTAFNRAITFASPFIAPPCTCRQPDEAAGVQRSRASVSAKSDFAHDVHRPQPSPTPRWWGSSSGEHSPRSAALTMSRSVTALQRQMYMTRSSRSMRGRWRCRAIFDRRDPEPRRGNQHHQIREPLAIEAFGPVGLGRDMPELVVEERHCAGLEEFMEGVDDELQRKDQQEDGGDLEEARQVDAPAVTRPCPGDERGARDAHDCADQGVALTMIQQKSRSSGE